MISNNMKSTVKSIRLRHLCFGLSLILFSILGEGAWCQEPTSSMSRICLIAKNPENYDNRLVTVSGQVLSDGVHSTIINDQRCEQFGMLLFVDPGAKGENKLDAALSWCHRGTRGKLISGTFTGVFHFKPGSPPEHSIRVQRIGELVLKSTKTASATFPTPCPDAPPLETLVHESDHVDPQKLK